MKSLADFEHLHNENPKSQRLGQHFVNLYIKGQWGELFYCSDDNKSRALIARWLVDNQYTDQLPQQIRNL